jgi:hypothetical protein
MFLGSFLIQYFVMPPIMVDSFDNITNHLSKVYLSVLMGIYMVIIEVAMHDMQYNIVSFNKYLILFVLKILFIYLYRKQVYVSDKDYLKGMIEHHSMGIFTSEEIVKKTDNYNVAKIAKNIIQKQKDEIREMKEIIDKI